MVNCSSVLESIVELFLKISFFSTPSCFPKRLRFRKKEQNTLGKKHKGFDCFTSCFGAFNSKTARFTYHMYWNIRFIYIYNIFYKQLLPMLKATLQFMSLHELWTFKTSVPTLNITILKRLHVLIGEFSEEELQFACNAYNASIIKKQLLSTNLSMSNGHL